MPLPESITKELAEFIANLQISDTHIRFKEKKWPVTPEQRFNRLVELLYSECYSLKKSGAHGRKHRFAPEDRAGFVQRLQESNHSVPLKGAGWSVQEIFPGGFVEVVKGAASKVVPASQVRKNAEINPGDVVHVEFRNGDNTIQEGFYYAYSNQAIDNRTVFVRVYWNITKEGAPPLLSAITTVLNRYAIPFLFKCLDHPQYYYRRDAAVVYLESRHLALALQLLPGIIETVKAYLEPDVPLFTYRFRPGVGIAESPNENESLGMHRSRLVSAVLLDNPQANRTIPGVIGLVENAFLRQGLDPGKPYLNKGSKLLYGI